MSLPPLIRLTLRAALVLGAAALGWRQGGPVAGLLVGVAGALWLTRPLVDLGADAVRTLRAAAWHDLEGRHYEFRQHRFYVRDDDEGRRWVRWRDVQQVLGPGTRDGVMARTWGASWRVIGGDGCLEAEALARHLSRDSRDEAAKLRHWVERDIAFPARRRREGRVGVETLGDSAADEARQLHEAEAAEQQGRRAPDADEPARR